MFSSIVRSSRASNSVAQFYGTEIRPFSLRVQHPSVGHVDEQGVSLVQPDPSALLGAVHVVAGVVPAHGAARLHQHGRLAVLFDALTVDVLDELRVADVRRRDARLHCVLGQVLVVAEASLGVNVVESRLHDQQFALLVAHLVAVSVHLVPVNGDGLRLTLFVARIKKNALFVLVFSFGGGKGYYSDNESAIK